MNLKDVHKNAKELMKLLRLRTYPLAIKMLENKNNILEEAERPLRDMGYHLDLCQGFAMSRWEGKTIAMLKEDMWCFEPVIGYGLAEPPKDFIRGYNRFPACAMTKEAAERGAEVFPRLEVGKHVGIISAPLEKCNFEPDIFVVYCDPSQLTQILIAKNAIDGEDIYCSLSGHDACVYAIVPVLQKGKSVVTSPCRGDRCNAMTQNNELIFSSPIKNVKDFVKSLYYLKEHSWGYPWPFEWRPERKLDENAIKMGRAMGIKC